MEQQDLIVIGGGAGGLNVASAAAQLGLKVTLVEARAKLGGDCLHYGCVPSKALIHIASTVHRARQAEAYGMADQRAGVADMAAVMGAVHRVIEQLAVHDDPERFRSYGCDVLFGRAAFLNPHCIQVAERTLQAKRLVIACGSSPVIPPIPGLADVAYLTNETIFQLTQLPRHLVVLGGGVVGLELAQAFRRLGSAVTVIEMNTRLLPTIDLEVMQVLQQVLRTEGVELKTAVTAQKVRQQGDEVIVECQDEHQNTLNIVGDQLLVAVGRQPNIAGLDLAKAQVQHSPQGIRVDSRLRTSQKHIYALGDVIASPYKLTHMAEYQAGIVIANSVFHLPKRVKENVVPVVMYTDPEVATVGLSPEQAHAKGLKPCVLQWSFADIDRAVTDDCTAGMMKVVVNKNKIIGAVIVGPKAGELLAEIVLAMQANLSIKHISAAIHAYPTLAQINRRAINCYYSPKLFNPTVRKWVRRLNQWL